jgi:hypothetical protein
MRRPPLHPQIVLASLVRDGEVAVWWEVTMRLASELLDAFGDPLGEVHGSGGEHVFAAGWTPKRESQDSLIVRRVYRG